MEIDQDTVAITLAVVADHHAGSIALLREPVDSTAHSNAQKDPRRVVG